MNKESDCLYHLPQDRYERVIDYFRRNGRDESCACNDCLYFRRRVMSKKLDPRTGQALVPEYNTSHYQAYLRATRDPNTMPTLTIMQINQFEELLTRLFGSNDG